MRNLLHLVFFLAIAAALVYFSMNNSAPASVQIYEDYQVEDKPLSVFILASFFLGVAITFLFGLLGKITGFFRSRGERKKHAKIVDHHEELVTGRELLAAGDFEQAEGTFQKLFNRNSEDLLASSMLAETLHKQGNYEEALKVVDKARQTQPENIELLFLGAKINEDMKNYTAAYDNLAIVVKKQPRNIPALKKLVSMSAPLKRFDEAIDYQSKLMRLVENSERPEQLKVLADLELAKAKTNAAREGSSLKQAIEGVVKRHKNYSPALAALGDAFLEDGDKKTAVRLFSKSYTNDCNAAHLDRVADILVAEDEPQKALEVLKKSIQSVPGEKAIGGRISLVNLFLRLEMIEEAQAEFEKLQEDCPKAHPARVKLDIAGAELVRRSGSIEEAFDTLKGAVQGISTSSKPALTYNG